MRKFYKNIKGSITIFLALIMVPMLTLSGVVIDGARLSTARNMISGAGDLALNSAMSEYDEMLYNLYGVFAVSEDMDELQENVNRYFENTLTSKGLLEDSDSYSRQFINSIFGAYSSDELSFSNIIELEPTDTFKLSGVGNSALANPSVLERQIIDYMKYRAPINMGKGLLTKLGCLGETSKQTKAIEKKIDYEKKLDTVQDACETAYKAINAFQSTLKKTKYNVNEYKDNLKQAVNTAKNKTQTMTEYLLAYKNGSYKVNSIIKTNYTVKDMYSLATQDDPFVIVNYDSKLRKEVDDYYNSLVKKQQDSAKNKDNKKQETTTSTVSDASAVSTLKYIENKLTPYISLIKQSNGTYEIKETEYAKATLVFMQTFNNANDTLADEVKIISAYNKIPSVQTVATLVILYDFYYDKLTEDKKAKGTDYYNKYDAILSGGGPIIQGSYICEEYRNGWKNKANDNGKAAAKALYDDYYKDLDTIIESLGDAVEALDAVLKKVDNLKDARTNWNNSLNALSDSEVKTSMKGDYQNSAKDINRTAVETMRDILSANKKHFEAVKKLINDIEYYGKDVSFKDYNSADFSNRYSKIPKDKSYSEAANLIKSNYKNANIDDLKPESFTKINKDEDKQQFYKYLCKICENGSEAEGTSKKAAKKQKENILAAGNEGETSSKGTTESGKTAKGYSGSAKTVSGAITDDMNKAIEKFNNTKANGLNEFKSDKIEGKKDSDQADKGKNNLTAVGSMFSSLSDVVEKSRDRLYLQEYMTEMFSCRTDTVKTDGKIPPALALNGQTMNNNLFFGAEVEYILWGKDTIQKNLDTTKASIFALRFALNSVYAFTSSDIRTPALSLATAIAGWTGFGVPIVQTVIILGWSMAESVVDTNAICNGEDVALYKSKDTWCLGIGGLKSMAAEALKDAANIAVDDIFSKVENVVTTGVNNAGDQLKSTAGRYVDDTLAKVQESVEDALIVPIEKLALQIADGGSKFTKTQIVDKLDSALKEIVPGDGLVGECTKLAIDALLKTATKNEIAEKLIGIYNASLNGTAQSEIEKMLYGEDGKGGIIGDIRTKVANAIKDKISAFTKKYTDEINKAVTENLDKSKDAVKDQIGKFTAEIGGSSSGEGTGSVSAAKGFTMNYSEYLKCFVLLGILNDGGKDAMLIRTAKLIQGNMVKKNANFKITNAYTMIQLRAKVNVKTTFFNSPLSANINEDGTTSYQLDISSMGAGRQKISYSSVLGY